MFAPFKVAALSCGFYTDLWTDIQASEVPIGGLHLPGANQTHAWARQDPPTSFSSDGRGQAVELHLG